MRLPTDAPAGREGRRMMAPKLCVCALAALATILLSSCSTAGGKQPVVRSKGLAPAVWNPDRFGAERAALGVRGAAPGGRIVQKTYDLAKVTGPDGGKESARVDEVALVVTRFLSFGREPDPRRGAFLDRHLFIVIDGAEAHREIAGALAVAGRRRVGLDVFLVHCEPRLIGRVLASFDALLFPAHGGAALPTRGNPEAVREAVSVPRSKSAGACVILNPRQVETLLKECKAASGSQVLAAPAKVLLSGQRYRAALAAQSPEFEAGLGPEGKPVRARATIGTRIECHPLALASDRGAWVYYDIRFDRLLDWREASFSYRTSGEPATRKKGKVQFPGVGSASTRGAVRLREGCALMEVMQDGSSKGIRVLLLRVRAADAGGDSGGAGP